MCGVRYSLMESMHILLFLCSLTVVQYFVRNPEGMFPYAPAAWSEIR